MVSGKEGITRKGILISFSFEADKKLTKEMKKTSRKRSQIVNKLVEDNL